MDKKQNLRELEIIKKATESIKLAVDKLYTIIKNDGNEKNPEILMLLALKTYKEYSKMIKASDDSDEEYKKDINMFIFSVILKRLVYNISTSMNNEAFGEKDATIH